MRTENNNLLTPNPLNPDIEPQGPTEPTRPGPTDPDPIEPIPGQPDPYPVSDPIPGEPEVPTPPEPIPEFPPDVNFRLAPRST